MLKGKLHNIEEILQLELYENKQDMIGSFFDYFLSDKMYDRKVLSEPSLHTIADLLYGHFFSLGEMEVVDMARNLNMYRAENNEQGIKAILQYIINRENQYE